MNKIYDKLLLVAALAFVGVGAFLYLKSSGQAPAVAADVETSVTGDPYQPEPVPESVAVDANWPEAIAQSAGPEWIYDVFTPPEIYLDADGNFVPTGWEPPEPPPPFGVYLQSIVREAYRLQLEGYIEEDRSDPSKTLLLFVDEETDSQVRARPGDVNEDSAFEVLSVDIDRLRDANNNIEVVAQATILDQRTNEEIVLFHGERKFEDEITATLRSELDASFVREFNQAPAEFTGPGGDYTLLEISLEESAVTVEKHGSEDEEPRIETLYAREQDAPSDDMPPPSGPGSDSDSESNSDMGGSDELDDIFNF